MNGFLFDLQRFVDYSIIAGNSATITGNSQTKTFSVTTGTETVNYSIGINGSATVSTDTDGTVKFTVANGSYIQDFFNTNTGTRDNIILLSGTVRNNQPGQPVTFGENGPTFPSIWANLSLHYIEITLTKKTDYDEVKLTPSNNGYYISGFTIGDFSYKPANGGSITAKIKDGRTYIDVSQNNSSDTIKYGTQTYSPVSGTVTLAVDKDGSNFAITGLEKGDKFKLGNITYTMSSARLMATNEGGTTHFLNQRVVAGTGEILVSSLSLLPENLDNTKYYTCLNPGLVSLLTDSTAATQYTGTNYSTTGVAIGVSNTAITMGVPSKLSANNITQIFLDITPPTTSSAVLNVHFPYNTASFFFKLTVTNSGTLQVDAYTDSTLLATTGTINLANYEVNTNAPIRLGLQTNFDDDTTGNKTYVNLVVGSYVYNQQLETNILFNETNRLFSFVSDSGNEVKISNIIVRDEQISSLAERIVALPVSVTDTDMTENNGLYTATTADQTLLQTPDVSSLIATYGEASPVTNVLVVGNPAYRTGDGITTLTSIDKTGNTITDHNTITLGTNTLAAASDCWALSNITLNDFANMQFGWKTGASS